MNDKPFAEYAYIDGYRHIKIAGIEFPAGGLTEYGIRQGADAINSAVSALVAAARKEEREAMKERCAKVVLGFTGPNNAHGPWNDADPYQVAAAIRALGE